MADLMQLDKAAALAGKSEVTLRRLIKAGKIPFQKEKTLTGFIYMVDPEKVRAYYHIRGGGVFDKEGQASTSTENPYTAMDDQPTGERPGPSYMPKTADPVRIAIGGENGQVVEYWQKRSELYEDKYHQEVQKYGQAREELGMWRGRAEQAHAMLLKLLPPAETPATAMLDAKETVREGGSWVTSVVAVLITLILCGGVGAVLYIKMIAGH